ncbi:MAG: hypothetical protein ACLS3M_01955 [Collinsella sp.]
MQELYAHALVDLERDARRIGTVRDQARGGMERSGIGVLVLKTTGIGHQAAQQVVATPSRATMPQLSKAVDDHGAGRGADAPQAQLGKFLARRMVIETHHMRRAAEHLG